MDGENPLELLETLSIKASVVNKFRDYCQTISMPHSTALLMMISYFENNEISVEKSLEPRIQSLENLINKRINGLTAIIRDIEKTQTKPSREMLQLLFQESPDKNKELVHEKKRLPVEQRTQNEMDILKYQQQARLAREQLKGKSRELNLLLEKVIVTRNSFGQVQLRLNMSKTEFEKLK